MEQSALYDLCIVGAGLVGSAAARHASADPNCSVCLIGPLDATDEEKKNGRSIFSCHYDEGRITRIFDPIFESQVLNRNSISRYHEIAALSGISFYNPVGCLYFGKRGSELTDAAHYDSKCLATLVDITTDFKSCFPFLELREDEVAFLESSPAGYISATKLVAAQQKIAINQGCVFLPEVVERVREQQANDGTEMVVTTSSGKKIRAKKVLLCTNTFTNFKELLPEGKVADLEYERSQVSLLKINEDEAERLSKMPSMIYSRVTETDTKSEDSFHVYVLPPIKYPDGEWYAKIGWSPARPEVGLKNANEVRDWYLSTGLPERTDILTETLKRLVPGLNVESYKGMTCSTCHTRTSIPYIDMVTPTLGVAIGGCGTSAKSSDELGRIAAKLTLEAKWISELNQERFVIQWK